MNRVEKYCHDVLNGKIIAGETTKLAVKRYLKDLESSKKEDYPYYFDERYANELINYSETLLLAEGTKVKPLKLYPFQAFILGNLNGWRYKINPKIRRFRENYTQIARQCGKSMLSGVIVSYFSNFTDYKYPQCYLCATKTDQSKIVLKEIIKFLNADAELGQFFKIKEYKAEVECLNTKGYIRALSGDTKSLDGLRASIAIVDEYHSHKTDQMKKLMQDSQVTLENALLSCITTAGFNTNYPCYSHYAYCKSILEGAIERDDIFIFIAEMDKDDDPFDENNWYKSNPTIQYNKTVLKNFRTNAIMAKEKGGEEMSNFLVKMCNQWLNGSLDKQFIQTKDLLDCATDKTIEFLKGKSVVCGLDLSSGGDLTSLALEYKYQDDDGKDKYYIFSHSFIPSNRLEEHEKTDKVPYKIWQKEGLITVTEGWKTDYHYIVAYLKDLIDKYDITIDSIYYDPHNASAFLSDLEEVTPNLIEVTQSARSLNDATVDLQLEFKSRNIEYDKNNKLLIWSFNNAITTSNSFGEIKLDKNSSFNRIDACDAVICSHKGIFKNESSINYEKHINEYLNKLGW